MDTGNLQAKAREAGALLKAMGNERRLLILCHLAEGEKSVGELEDAIDLSRPACAGVNPSGSSRSAKRAAACAPSWASRNPGDCAPLICGADDSTATLELSLLAIVCC